MNRDETLLIGGGVALAAFLIYHHMKATPAGENPWALPDWLNPGAGVIPPGGGTITPPGGGGGTTVTPPPVTVTPPPGGGSLTPADLTPAASNAAFDASMAVAHQMQQDDFAAGVADLKAKVASGAIDPRSQTYRDHLDYLANLRGGVAAKPAELAALAAQGLAGGRRPFLRVVS